MFIAEIRRILCVSFRAECTASSFPILVMSVLALGGSIDLKSSIKQPRSVRPLELNIEPITTGRLSTT